MHPYEDEQFLSEHPDVKARVEKLQGTPLDAPPPYEKRRHSFSGGGPNTSFPSYNDAGPSGSTATPPTDEQREARKRGLLAKLKDKTIGTKEEREAHRKQKEEEREAHKKQKEEEREAHRKQKEAEREAYRKWKAEERAREEEELREARRRNLEERAAYMQRHGGYPPYGEYGGYPGYNGGYSGMYGPPVGDPYAYNSRRTGRTGFGGGGMALPLLGGLAGGLLLGDILDGGFGGGFDGGFGGGDFGGGGFF